MSTETTIDLNEALRAYGQARRTLDDYRGEYAPVFEMAALLEEELQAAQAQLTAALASREIDYVEDTDFAVTLVQQDRGEYVADRLPGWIVELAGKTVTTIDKRAMQKAIRTGLISDEDANAAWEPKTSKPYVKVAVKKGEST